MADVSHISDGATEGTPEGSGARYSTLAAYEAAQQGTLTTPNQAVLHANYSGGLGLNEDNVSFSGWVTTSTENIILSANPGEEYNYLDNTGARITGIDNAVGAVIAIGANIHLDMYGLGVFAQAGGTSDALDTELNSTDQSYGTTERCTLYSDTSGKAADLGRRHFRTFINNLLMMTDGIVIECDERGSEGAPCGFYSNTLIQNGATAASVFSINAGLGWSNDFENNVLYSAGGHACVTPGQEAAFISVANNATSDSVILGAGTGQQVAVTTVDFEYFASGDYRPSAGGKLDGTGFDNSADYTDDILGNTRTQWDIGAYGLNTGSPPLQSNLLEGGLFTTLSSTTVLEVQNLVQEQTLDNIELTQNHLLSVDNLTQVQTLDNIDLLQSGALDVQDLVQEQTFDNVVLKQAHILLVDGLVQEQAFEALTLTQNYQLEVQGIFQTQHLENVVLEVAGQLSVDYLTQIQTFENVDLVQHHVLDVDDIIQEQYFDNVEVRESFRIQVQNLIQEQTLQNITLSTGGLEVDTLVQEQTFENVDLIQHYVISVNNLTQEQVFETVKLGGLVVGSLDGCLTVFPSLNGCLEVK